MQYKEGPTHYSLNKFASFACEFYSKPQMFCPFSAANFIAEQSISSLYTSTLGK